jgi:hypothetical protein
LAKILHELFCNISYCIFNAKPPSIIWEIPSSLIISSAGVSVSLPNLPPNLVRGNSKEPLCPSIVGVAPKEKPTLESDLLILSIPCSGSINSAFATAPINAFNFFTISGSWTADFGL